MVQTKSSLSLVFAIAIVTFMISANAGDPDILSDFVVPPSIDPSTITRQFFTFTGFRNLKKANLTGKTNPIAMEVTHKEFPALVGQSVSVTKILFPPSGIIPPHLHPRSAGLLMVLKGTLEVGLLDSTNKLFVQTLRAPDLFLFPKGLVHYQVNVDSKRPAVAVAMFGSSSPGTVALPSALFGSGISEEVLAKAFKTDAATISHLIEENSG